MTTQVQELLINGVRTPCVDTGSAGATAVLLMHGNPGSRADWSLLTETLAPQHRVIAPDMPGFGRAAKPADFDYTVAGYARHIEALLADRGVTRVHLVLHDFGGPWGLAWAAANPTRVASITLINVGIARDYRWHFFARLWRTPLLGEFVMATTTRAGFRFSLRFGNPRGLPPDFVDGMYANFDRGTRRAVLRLYRATSAFGDAADHIVNALRPQDLECLVLWGKQDIYVPWRFAEQQREAFPRAQIRYLDDSGHWPHQDNPDVVNQAIRNFLAPLAAADHGDTA